MAHSVDQCLQLSFKITNFLRPAGSLPVGAPAEGEPTVADRVEVLPPPPRALAQVLVERGLRVVLQRLQRPVRVSRKCQSQRRTEDGAEDTSADALCP